MQAFAMERGWHQYCQSANCLLQLALLEVTLQEASGLARQVEACRRSAECGVPAPFAWGLQRGPPCP